jgi:hypothetical protein
VPERGALSFSLVFLWAYKEKVTPQQAKPKSAINTILFGAAMFLFRPAGRNLNPKATPISFKIPISNLRIVCCFDLTASQGACMPKPPNNPKGTPSHRPYGVHCATRKITVAAELAQNCGQFLAQTVLALIRYFPPLLVVAKGTKWCQFWALKALHFKS